MKQRFKVWSYPDATMEDPGEKKKHRNVRADIKSIQGARHVFCAVTGFKCRDLETTSEDFDDQYVRFHHRELGYVGGIEILEANKELL